MATSDTNTSDATLGQAQAMLNQTQAQGATPFAGSSYDTSKTTTPTTTTPAVNATLPASGVANSGTPYTIQSGDTLSQIAQKQGTTVAQLMASNPQITDPNKIQAGAQLNTKYQTALSTAQNSGTQPPQTVGDASSQIQDLTKQTSSQDQQQQQAGIDAAKAITDKMNQDPGFMQLQKDQAAYLSSQNQTKTLTEQYTDLSNQLGLPALNTQILNVKAIMDGTENDIRQEIQKSGGFATNSQILALTAARNTLQLQNYNNLLQTRDSLVNQINTTMGFAKEDAANATALASEKMNYDQQVISYEQKFTQNAQDSLKSMQASEGWDGIYKAAIASGDPNAVNIINQTMGQGFDLSIAAQNDAATKAQQLQTQANANAQAQATLANTQATTANTKATTAKTLAETAKLPVTPTASTTMPYNGTYKTPSDYVNAVLSKQGVSYAQAEANTPKGTVLAIDNQTGQTVVIDAKDWNASSGAIRPQYTVIFNNLK